MSATAPHFEPGSELVGETPAADTAAGGVAENEESWVREGRLIWGHRRFIFRGAVAGLALATATAFLIPKEYQSTTRLMPPDAQTSSGMAMLAALSARSGNVLGGVAGDLLGMKTSGALFVGILQSQSVQERLVQGFDLRKVYRARIMRDAVKNLSENTIVAEDRKNGIITIIVTDRSPTRARDLAKAYVEELDRLVSQLSTSAARRERVFLEERLKSVKLDLDAASERFGQFASKNTAIDIQAQGKAMVDAAARLQGELIATQAELEMVKQIYTESNVRVRSLRAREQELQRQLVKMSGVAGKKTIAGTQTADPLYPSIRELPLLGITYADLLRRAKIEETVYEILTQQYELAKVQEVKETPSVKVLDAPEVPELKSFPPRLLIMELGTLLSLIIASVWVLAHNRWSSADERDPRKVLAQEVFVTVKAGLPWAAKNGSDSENASQRIWRRLVKPRKQQNEAH